MGGMTAGNGEKTAAGEAAPSTGNTNQTWEDRMAAMSAKYGGGINFYNPVQY
jgi:hypothetical protein